MSKFTPGPWFIYNDGKTGFNGERQIWIGAKHPEVDTVTHAFVQYGCDEAEELGDIRANAQLITACPDMYRDLKSLVALVDAYAQVKLQSIEAQDLVARARLTIAKAEGRGE